MIAPGIYPASVTPFEAGGKIDWESMAKLLAWFESAGCQGAVLAGTNGEGPSLSATEKRDLIEKASAFRGKLDLILGIATPSLEEAAWLCRRAHDSGAVAALVMAPGYFREASENGISEWFSQLLDRSPVPVLIYNFPQRTGITLSANLMAQLAAHPQMAGLKDSSGNEENLVDYRQALKQSQSLFVGNETLLIRALENGWTGSISGAANSVPHGLCAILRHWLEGERDSAKERFQLLMPALEAIRTTPQPAGHKAVLNAFQVLATPDVRLPLENVPEEVLHMLLRCIETATGITATSALRA